METQALIVPDELVLNKIYFFRGHKVMLDSDLAALYLIDTKRLKEAVRRNPERFPEDFMFELTTEEFHSLRSQIATSNIGRGGTRYLPMVFTEHGVLMLSSVLNSAKAIQVNIQIMRIFTKVRQMLMDNAELRLAFEEIKTKVDKQGKTIELVFRYLDELLEKRNKPTERTLIGFKTK